MRRFALIVLAALAISGCSTLPRTVEIPVAVPCTPPPVVSRPHLAVSTLKSDSTPDVVIRAYAEALEALAGYAKELETILNGYRGTK